MEFLSAVGGLAMSCIAQACCWYTVFRQCGCIDAEREVIQTEAPRVVVVKKNENPFYNQQSYSQYPI